MTPSPRFAAAAIFGRHSSERPAMLYGCIALFAGVVITLAALAAADAATSLPGTRSAPASPAASQRRMTDLPPCPGTVPLCIHGDAAPGATALAGRS